MELSRSDELALAFTATYLVVAGVSARSAQNFEFVLYVGVMVALVLLVLGIHRRVRLHPASLWCLSAWGLLHMAGGLVRVPGEAEVLYGLWLVPDLLRYDQAVHAFGFGVATWVVWQGLARALATPRPTPGLLFVCFCAGMGLGALNEVVEFVAVLTLPETNVGGYENTGWDLVANAAGALVAALAIGLTGRRRPADGDPR